MRRTKFSQANILHHLKYLRKIAWSYHYTTGEDVDDLFSEACLCFLETIPKWAPEKGRVSTFMWKPVHNHLRNFLQVQKKYRGPLQEITRKVDVPVNNKPYFENLTIQSTPIAEILLKTPQRFIYLSQADAIRKVSRIMQANGISAIRIRQGIKHLQNNF